MNIKDYVEINEYDVRACKFLLEMKDGNTVEVARLEYAKDIAICMSCQVGCKHRCTFCANRLSPFVRNLSEAEIYDAVTLIQPFPTKKETVLDFSGIGDCSDNWDAVRNACISLKNRDVIQRYSFTSISPKLWCTKVSRELKEGIVAPSKFMISLHGFDAESRNRIIPHAEDPREAVAWWSSLKQDGVRIVMNYVLHSGNVNHTNDIVRYINEYARWIDVLRISPFNDVKCSPLTGLHKEEIEAAVEKIKRDLTEEISIVLFQPIGINKGLACGQMRAN